VQDFRRHIEEMYRQNRRAQRELEHQRQNYDALIAERNKAFNEAKNRTSQAK
jgi:hypothetical protein